MSDASDWNRFSVRINVRAAVNTLYHAWSTREGMEHWFLRVCQYMDAEGNILPAHQVIQKGDRYMWRWYGYPDEVEETGDILEANGRDTLSFSFGKAGICTVRLFEEGGDQIVEIIQFAIPTDEKARVTYYVGCKTGWTFYLANLKSLMEGGIDLRNKNEALQEMLNA